MITHTIRYELAEGIATLTINRPQVMNALHVGVIEEMIDAVDRVRDEGTARVLVVGGGPAGGRGRWRLCHRAGHQRRDGVDQRLQHGGYPVLQLLQQLDVQQRHEPGRRRHAQGAHGLPDRGLVRRR